MIDLNDRAERDADLLDDAYTPAMARLSATLDKAYAGTPPPHLDAAMLRALHERTAAPRRLAPRRWQRRPVGILGLALLGVALLAGAVFAISQIEQAFELDQGATDVFRLSTPVNLSTSGGDYTLTVQRAYADANNVIAAYTLTAKGGGSAGFNDPLLTDARGVSLPLITDVGGGAVRMADYNADRLKRPNGEIHLRLIPPVKGLAPLSFAVPFTAGRQVEPHQAVTVGGKTLTLERVIATASATRLYLSGPLAAATTTVDLRVDGHAIAEHLGWSSAGKSVHGFDPIDPAYKEAIATVHAWQGGPWTFHFTLP